MKAFDYIKPALVLMLICAIISGLLAFAYNATYVDNTGVLTEKLLEGCTDIFGQGEYEMIVNYDEEGNKIPLTFEGITSVIIDEKGNCLFEMYADGYEKGGMHMLVGISPDGSVAGMYMVDISETPGLGTNVNSDDYFGKFIGMKSDDEPQSVDNITGASRSSKGFKNAIALAISTYAEQKEVIFSE